MSKEIIGHTINNKEDHWRAECPKCNRSCEFTGFYDEFDVIECEKCGLKFKIIRIWFDNDTYMGRRLSEKEGI